MVATGIFAHILRITQAIGKNIHIPNPKYATHKKNLKIDFNITLLQLENSNYRVS